MDVMPQMGFPMPRRVRVYLQDRNVISNGLTVTVGFTKQMRGKVIYNMTADTARYIASTMMLGVPVNKFGDLAQSALREMSNMLTAHAAMGFAQMGLEVDITTPELTISEDHTIKISDSHYLTVEMEVGEYRIDIALAVDREY
jgi:chemotaxis protein CheX